jgi:hypothetical protein
MSGLSGASTGLKAAGGVASMIPGYGTIIGGALSGIGGILDMVDAGKQKKDAEALQKKAEQVKKGALEPQYLQALRGYMMQAQSGMPSFEASKSALDASSANALKSIIQASPHGQGVADSINAILNSQSQQQQVLEGQQGQFKFNAKSKALDYLSGVGDKNRELTIEQRKRQEALYSQAQDLLAASTANKQIGREKALGGGIMAAGGIAKLAGKGFKPSAKDGGFTDYSQPTDQSVVSTGVSAPQAGSDTVPDINTLDANGIGGLDVTSLGTDHVTALTDRMNQALTSGDYETAKAIRAKINEWSSQPQ